MFSLESEVWFLGVKNCEENSWLSLQKKLSLGSNLTAENRIFPNNAPVITFVKEPNREEYRDETSTYSYVRTEGERRTRRGTQCADATSVGCRVRGGRVGEVCRKTKGHKTIILFSISK